LEVQNESFLDILKDKNNLEKRLELREK